MVLVGAECMVTELLKDLFWEDVSFQEELPDDRPLIMDNVKISLSTNYRLTSSLAGELCI